MSSTRRGVVAIALATFIAMGTARAQAAHTLTSPGGRTAVSVFIDDTGRASYRVMRDGQEIISPSPLGVRVDGIDLGQSVGELSALTATSVDRTYASLGAASELRDHCRQQVFVFDRTGAGDDRLEVAFRAYDDGVAFRYRVGGPGDRTFSGEATGWSLPAGSMLYYQANTSNYEGPYNTRTAPIGQAYGIAGAPVTVALADGGYMMLAESNVSGYSGISFRAHRDSLRLTNDFWDDQQWQVPGGAYTPWRVVTMADDLDGLVNSSILSHVADDPDPALFPAGAETDWIRPGRALWSWWSDSSSPGDYQRQVQFVDAADELGFEHVLVDDGWYGWNTAGGETFANLVDYAHRDGRNVDIWVWHHWASLSDPSGDWYDLRHWLDQMAQAGVAGVKVDFMNSESQQMLAFYEAVLTKAAEREIMVNFHGSNKPAGEARTWPNEMTRESVRGLEYARYYPMDASHTVLLPFTRCLAGATDFTPGYFGHDLHLLEGVTWAQNLAAGVLITSPVMHWASSVEDLLSAFPDGSRRREVFRAIPAVWDETVVLPASRMGELAAMARRDGERWFLAAMRDGDEPVVEAFSLDFLTGEGVTGWRVTILGDDPNAPDAFSVDRRVMDSADALDAWLAPGGGVVAMLEPLLPGDANADDTVDVGDLGILASEWGTVADGRWDLGDFTGDDAVDVGDLGVLAAHFGATRAARVPEPAVAPALLAAAGAMTLRRRRRRGR